MLKKLSKLLHHTFIPHEGNEYKPHFFRETATLVLLFIGVFLLGVSAGAHFFLRQTVLGATLSTNVLIDLANQSRVANNEPTLVKNDLLSEAAYRKGTDMATKGYFAHNSPEGVTPWHWFKEVGYVFLYAGENLAINFTQETDIQQAWLNSPSHRENLLNGKFKEIGIATVEGLYENTPTIFVVQMFGTPAKAKTASTPLPTSTSTETTTSPDTLPQQESSPSFSSNEQEVKGSATSENEVTIQKLMETNAVVAVVDTGNEAVEISPQTQEYSPWYGKYLYHSNIYINTLYRILIGFVLGALFLMVVIEIKRQHYKHISYGVLVISSFMLLLYINHLLFT